MRDGVRWNAVNAVGTGVEIDFLKPVPLVLDETRQRLAVKFGLPFPALFEDF